MWKWSPDDVAKATNLIDCYDETQNNNRTRGSTVSDSRNHRAAVLNSILYNRFVVRWFSRPARYAWLLSQWNCRYCTFFFFFKATPIAAERATLPTVCRLPVVPGCACVRFWRAIIGLNIILIVIMIYYSHYGYESAKSLEKSYLRFTNSLLYVELILVKLIVSQISGIYMTWKFISDIDAVYDIIQYFIRILTYFFCYKIIF